MKHPLRSAFLVSLFLALAVGTVVHAADRYWTDGATTDLASDPSNWNGHAPPTSGDALTFSNAFSATWDLPGVTPLSVSTAGNFTLQQPLTSTGRVAVTGGTLRLNANALNVGGDFTLSGGMLDAASAPVSIGGNWTVSGGSAALTGSTVTFVSAGTKTITASGTHFGNLTVNGASVSLGDALAVDGTLTISGGALAVGTRTLTVSENAILSGGSLSLDGGTLVLAGSSGKPLTVTGGALTVAPGSTVEYRPTTGAITTSGGEYANLKLSGTSTFTLGGDTTVTGTLTIGEHAALTSGGHILNVPSGSITNNGIILADHALRAPARSFRVVDQDGADVTAITTSSRTIYVRLEDASQNRRGATEETATGIVFTTLSGDKENVAAIETGPATGVFMTGPIVVHQGTATALNGQVELAQTDIIFVNYTDPDDATDHQAAQLTVQLSGALMSGAPQVVSDPRLTDWGSITTGSGTTYSARFNWETDQVTTSAVSVSSTTLTAPMTGGSLTGTTSHQVTIAGLKRGVDYSYTVTSVTADGKSVTTLPRAFVVVQNGDRIKSPDTTAVYWYLNDTRNVFPDPVSYDSWFVDFNDVVTVPAEQLSDIPLGKIVPIRAGTYMVKITSDPKVYAVEPFGALRWVPTESRAIALYGAQWATRVRDVDVSLFASYTVGAGLNATDVPDNFFYQIGGGEWRTYVGGTEHVVTDGGILANSIAARFVSAIAPAVVAGAKSGATYSGFAPDIDGVFVVGGKKIIAPSFH